MAESIVNAVTMVAFMCREFVYSFPPTVNVYYSVGVIGQPFWVKLRYLYTYMHAHYCTTFVTFMKQSIHRVTVT